MDELVKLLLKPPVKAGVLAIFTIAIGILTSAAVNHYNKWFMWVALIVLVALYIWVLIAYTKKETNLIVQINDLTSNNAEAQKLFKIFQTSTQGLNAMCKISAKQTNMKM